MTRVIGSLAARRPAVCWRCLPEPRFAAPAQDWRTSALASFDDAWQTINETFYDPTFGGVDWDGVETNCVRASRPPTSMEATRAM